MKHPRTLERGGDLDRCGSGGDALTHTEFRGRNKVPLEVLPAFAMLLPNGTGFFSASIAGTRPSSAELANGDAALLTRADPVLLPSRVLHLPGAPLSIGLMGYCRRRSAV